MLVNEFTSYPVCRVREEPESHFHLGSEHTFRAGSRTTIRPRPRGHCPRWHRPPGRARARAPQARSGYNPPKL